MPIVVLGCGATKSALGLAARADRGLTLPTAIKGAKIGYQPVNRTLLKAILKANKLSENDITPTVVTGDPTMLIEGRIDLMTVSVLNVPLAMKERGIEASTWLAYDLGVPLQGSVVTCLENTLTKRRDEITRFLGALGKGWAYNIAHPDEVAATVAAEFGEGPNVAHQTAYNRGQTALISTDVTKSKGLFWIERSSWEAANAAALDTGIIGTSVEPRQSARCLAARSCQAAQSLKSPQPVRRRKPSPWSRISHRRQQNTFRSSISPHLRHTMPYVTPASAPASSMSPITGWPRS